MADVSHPVRVFLVGFPRSGTTLVQSLLAAHPEVMSLPETFFFVRVAAPGRRWRLLRRAHPEAGTVLRQLQEQGIEVRASQPREALPIGSLGPAVRRFVLSLDDAVERHGKRAWVEKTPSHLHHLDTIERYVTDAQFVHVVRAGLPAVASMHAVTYEHPASWGGVRSIEVCASRWRGDLQRSLACVGRENHQFVSYERLVDDPDAQLLSLVQRLGLRSDPGAIATMLGNYAQAAPGLADKEPWKAAVGAPIQNRNQARVAELFTAEEQGDIERAIGREERLRTAMPFV